MFINFSPVNLCNKINQNNLKKQNVKYPKLAPLAYDTISFGAMKKTMFDGIDLAVVQKFSAPIEKFNSNEDLQNWANEKAEEIVNKDYEGRREETKIQRKAMIKEWADYVLKENDAYKKTTALLILSAITKDLDSDNDNLPPVLNKGVLADCIAEIDKNIKNDSKYQFNLNKMYRNKLRAFYSDDMETSTGETATKWVVIPSKKNDPENFEANVEKLKALSYKTWCTKSFNAKPYLTKGDFHVYLEDGKPKLGVRFVGNEIQEIQGERNNGKIPLNYLDIMQNHISENNLSLTKNAQNEIQSAKEIKKEIEKVKKDLSEAIKNNDIKKIYGYFGIEIEEDENGYLTISEYKQPSKIYAFEDLGIDENKLLKKVKTITGDADFSDSLVTDLSSLETIGKDAYFGDSKITDLSSLETIGGDADFRHSQVTDLRSLKTVGGDADFRHSQVTDLRSLRTIGKDARFGSSQTTGLSSLEIIGGDADFECSQATDLRSLRTIGGDADFYKSQVTDLSNLETIGRHADFRYSQVTNLSSLKTVGGWADFSCLQVTDLSNLETIGEHADFGDSQVTDLRSLRTIGGKANFNYSKVNNIESLKFVKGTVHIANALLTIEDFRNVDKIGVHKW